MLRRASLLGVTVLALGAGTLHAAAPSEAASGETYVPRNGSFTVRGMGWGHGVGMSQYGAQGGATKGKDAAQILAAYYPHTRLTDAGNPTLRVLVDPDGGGGAHSSTASSPFFRVAATSGLTLVDFRGPASQTSAPLPRTVGGSSVSTWGVSLASGKLSVRAYYKSAWHAVDLTGTKGAVGTASAGPLEVRSSTGKVTLRGLNGASYVYRGRLRAKPTSSSALARVNFVPMEDYLLGVVPSEMPASWKPAALQAQAVAARTYAAHARGSGGGSWDICDSTSCQVYRGVGGENALSTSALRNAPGAVAGKVLTYRGTPISAMFSSSNGGASLGAGSSYPYLPGRVDPWDTTWTDKPWTDTLSAGCLSRTYGGGRALKRLVVTRDGIGPYGGHVTSVRLLFEGGGTKTLAGSSPVGTDAVMRGLGGTCDRTSFKSSLFTFGSPAPTPKPSPTPSPTTTPAATVTDPHLRLGTAPVRAGRALVATRASNGAVWLRTWTAASGLGSPTRLGGKVWSAPAVVRGPGGRLEVYARHAGDARLYVRTRASSSTSWSAWSSLGGTIGGPPSAATAPDGRVYVFVRGSAGHLAYRSHTANGRWSRWHSLGGTLATHTGPAAVATGDGRLRVVVRGSSGRLSLKTRWATGRWSHFTRLSGAVAGTPSVSSDRTGRFTLATRGTDGHAYVTDVVGSTRGAWRDLGGRLHGDPVLTAVQGSGRTDLLANLTADPDLQRRTRTGSAWYSWRSAQ